MSSNNNQNIQTIDNQLKSLKLIRKEIPKDGACMFRCISEFIYGTQDKHQYVRQKCVDYLIAHRDSFEPFACINNPWDKYIQEMKKDNTWGGEVELQALSLYYKVNFVIYLGNSTTRVDNNYKTTISLAYCQGEHYDIVYPISHLDNLQAAQSLVYQILYERLQIECVDEMFNWKNNPIVWWGELVKIKQQKDKKIVDTLKSHSRVYVDPVEEYQLQLKKKKREEEEKKRNEQNKKNNKKNSTLNTSKDSGHNNTTKSSPNQPQSSPSKQQVSSVPTATTSNEPQEEIDDDLKEIIRQIEEQDLEEQRKLGREKHFPQLGGFGSKPNHNNNINNIPGVEPKLTILPDIPKTDTNNNNVDENDSNQPQVGSMAWKTAQLWAQIASNTPPPSLVPETTTTTTTSIINTTDNSTSSTPSTFSTPSTPSSTPTTPSTPTSDTHTPTNSTSPMDHKNHHRGGRGGRGRGGNRDGNRGGGGGGGGGRRNNNNNTH